MTALNEFNQNISKGFNKKKPADRTVLLQIDLSKAFDMVSHQKLLKDINNTTLPDPIKRWLNSYLRGRQSRVNFRGETSSARNVKAGVPQGAVTSPILFNFYISRLPVPPDGVNIVMYADDLSVYASGTDLIYLSQAIQSYIDSVLIFLKERELEVSPTKSTVTLFTPDTKEAQIHPTIKIDGVIVKLDKTPKLLGVKFDTMYTFSHHIKEQAGKGRGKNNIIKCLAGTTWGQDKETLLITYKAISRSTLEYGAPIWAPMISDSNWTKLQTVQNQALRTATGCLAMTSLPDLHRECKVLPIKEHSTLLTKQFTAGCFVQSHPGNKFINKVPPDRKLKATHLAHEAEVAEKFRSGTYKDAIKSLHTSAVSQVISNYPPNRVLQDTPPEINTKEEQTLPRKARSGLARLRTGFCRTLNSYMSRIDEEIQDICPNCDSSPHNSNHLFNCPANPTNLNVSSLWTKPKDAAIFLNLIPHSAAAGQPSEDVDEGLLE